MKATSKGLLLRLACMTILPVVLVTLYMIVTRNVDGYDIVFGDYTAIYVSMLIGLIAVFSTPIIWRYRILSSLLYLPVSFYGLAVYMFVLHVGITGDGP